MDHKRQHWIPQGYLKAWCDPNAPNEYEPYVWQFVKDGSSVRKRAPKKILHEPDLYTISSGDGDRDLHVEHGLAKLESRFVNIREEKLARNRPLTEAEHIEVCAFIAAMQGRTPFQLNHWRANWEQVAEMGRDLQRDMDAGRAMPRSIPGSGPFYTQADVEGLATAERGTWVAPMLKIQLPILCDMSLTILTSDDSLGFITSDCPCVWFDPEAYRLPAFMQGPGLGSRTIEITLPCSPSQTLLLTWALQPGTIPIGESLLNELNRRTRFHAREHFITRSNEARREWFEIKTPPKG